MSDSVPILAENLLQLMKHTGYPITQVNGQRKFGPPAFWSGPPPPKGCEVFIGKLPREIFEDILVPLFSKAGIIYELRLMMDFSGSNRGYAFLTYTTRTAASEAVRQLDNHQIIPGRHIGVVKSVDNCRLFIGGVPKYKNKEEILGELTRHVDGIIEVILYANCHNRKQNRGFAFVEFKSHRAAAMARRALVPGRVKLWDQEIMVDWAEPELDVDDELMRKVKVLYIRNLLLETDQKTLQNIIEDIIQDQLEHIKKINDYAFVHFKTREQAESALKKLTNLKIENSKIEVKWSKPVDRDLYRIHKYNKGNAKFNTTLRQFTKQFQKTRDLTSPNDEGFGSASADGSACSSPLSSPTKPQFTDEFDLAPARLESICKQYAWGIPKYDYSKEPDFVSGVDMWRCIVEVPQVGLPLVLTPCRLGPLIGAPALTVRAATAKAAEWVLHIFKTYSMSNMMQQTLVQSTVIPQAVVPQPMVPQTAVPTVVPHGVPGYNYMRPMQYPISNSPYPGSLPNYWANH